jgi:hypothetical protein
MAKKRHKRRRSTSEKILIILGILITLSMVASLIAGLGSGGRSDGQAPLPIEHYEYIEVDELNDSGEVIPNSGSGVTGRLLDPPG